MELMHQLMNFGAVLGPDPIQFEPVSDPKGEPLTVLGQIALQGLDPGVELLLWEFLRQAIDALLPQTGI